MSVFKNIYFIIPCILFWINQAVERLLGIYIPYVHAYLDDLLAMPVVLGVTLQVFRWIHPSRNLFYFTKVQLLVGWLYFSFLFEVLLPRWSATYTADIWDVLCYAIGTVIFDRLINRKH
ncbi:magnesium citrate secondary transporter [Belliella sp. R4-6]|uniref:Magnesium citrate secondary transporter n=1 Tax=Belliella alkalica TaxID=1730871 RepID=A0ABS9VAG2_9BACT|nr:magnesium citrate secondary transporter [Belliella alkalica]MCH7413055.1 magnesium citrate secondary transporter [Belliella alkalica]